MQYIPAYNYATALLANGAGLANKSAISYAIMASINNLLPPATNIPTGSDVQPVQKDHKAGEAIDDVAHLYNNQPVASTSLVALSTTIGNVDDDNRTADFITAVNNGVLTASAIIFDRGARQYGLQLGLEIMEDELTTALHGNFGKDFTGSQRSMVIAGYLVLLHAGGNQQHINRVLLFLNGNTEELFRWYEYYARHSNAYYLLRQHRVFFGIRSHAGTEHG